MKNVTTPTTEGIKKLHIEATVLFAIEHIPTVDEVTLTKFLELVNATGNFPAIRSFSRWKLPVKPAAASTFN